MLSVSLKDFKKQPIIYLDKVNMGAEVLIRKEKVKVKDDTLMSEEELLAKIK